MGICTILVSPMQDRELRRHNAVGCTLPIFIMTMMNIGNVTTVSYTHTTVSAHTHVRVQLAEAVLRPRYPVNLNV